MPELCAGSMGLAQVMCLIDSEPQDAEALATLAIVLEGCLQPVLELGLARLDRRVFAALPMRQFIQALGGMKDRRKADAAAQTVAQHQGPHHDGHIVAQLVPQMNQGAFSRLHSQARFLFSRLLANEERIEHRRRRAGDQVNAGVPGDGLSGAIPEGNPAFAVDQGNALRKAIQRGFKQLRPIGHPCPFNCFIGVGQANLTALRWEQKRLDAAQGRGLRHG